MVVAVVAIVKEGMQFSIHSNHTLMSHRSTPKLPHSIKCERKISLI
uniref:Uncharacterized protein n=1 Tax=Vitis vinifera TaxID=29760 RepID=F6H9F2_VITVI